MLAWHLLSSCVRLSACLSVTSRSCTKTAKRRTGSKKTTPHGSPAWDTRLWHKRSLQNSMGSPQWWCQMCGVCKNWVFFRPVEKSSAHTPYRRKSVSINYGGPRPRRCVFTQCQQQRWWQSKFVDHSHGLVDINNVGCRGCLFITRNLLLTSALHVAYAYALGIACSLCDIGVYCNDACTKLCW